MKEKIIETYYQKNYQYNILDQLKIDINLESDPYKIPLDELFMMAARKNKKRAFLFVSKVLGKHLPVEPSRCLLAGALLSLAYKDQVEDTKDERLEATLDAFLKQSHMKEAYESILKEPVSINDKPLVIGFAETATSLGGIVASTIKDADYLHTTRDVVTNVPYKLTFEEEHSHATTHKIYLEDKQILTATRPIIFVDDEITTGKTTLNIIREIHEKYPRETYTILSLLDWRNTEDIQRFKEMEKELGIKIHTVSLIKGNIQVEGKPLELENNDLHLYRDSQGVDTQSYHTEIQEQQIYKDNIFEEIQVDQKRYIKETGRFGVAHKEFATTYEKCYRVGQKLKQKRLGKQTLCLGIGEFMQIPMLIGAHMGEGISYHSCTRSPIYPLKEKNYAIQSKMEFSSPEHVGVKNFLYNIPEGYYDDLFVISERAVDNTEKWPMLNQLKQKGFKKITWVTCAAPVKVVPELGSYHDEDVTFLLKDISHVKMEQDTRSREKAIQSGVHYSEMLPIEYCPGDAYMKAFDHALQQNSIKVAEAVGIVAEKILKTSGEKTVLVSLARAGTPIGVLIRRYLKLYHSLELPHYSISIIRGKGIDENAIRYMRRKYPEYNLQFIDGWTGKGAITQVLEEAVSKYNDHHEDHLSNNLAVLADPAGCVNLYGTREDFLIPSACLNSTVSGLVSRTVLRQDLIGDEDFHGAKYYKGLIEEDVSIMYIDKIVSCFDQVHEGIKEQIGKSAIENEEINWQGLKAVQGLQKEYGIEDINLIKPGIGETTRVLLRRIPWKIIVKDIKNPELKHILLLAKEKSVEVIEKPELIYKCCGLIQPMRGEI